MAEEKKSVPQQPQLNINSGTVVGSKYSQFTIITVTDIDLTINFAFVHPDNPIQGEIVSRVTLPRPVAEDLARTILSTVKLHEERKREKKDGSN